MKDKNGKQVKRGLVMVNEITKHEAMVSDVSDNLVTFISKDYGSVKLGKSYLTEEHCVWVVK